jgi:hypothetical protein
MNIEFLRIVEECVTSKLTEWGKIKQNIQSKRIQEGWGCGLSGITHA